MSPISQYVALGTGLRYHLLRWDSPGGQDEPDHTVILLHGFLDLCWGWEEVVKGGLLDGAERRGRLVVLAPDLRGHGDSDRVGPGGYYHFLDYLADLHDLVLGQGGRVSLCGHSMGGSVAAYYAGSFPDRVHRLALLEGLGPPPDSQSIPERVPTWIAAWRKARAQTQRGYQEVAEAAERLRQHDPLLDAELALRLAEHGTRRGEDGLLRFKHDPLHVTPGPLPFRLELAEGFWRRVTCPTLLVTGERSLFRYGEEEERRRAACFGDARQVEIPGAGHMMQRHQPAALALALRDFLLGGP